MQRYHLYNKSTWEPGPWMDEPDYVAWIDPATAYPCIAKRNLFGAWVGYVGLDLNHPLYMAPVECEELDFVECHGGRPKFCAFSEDEAVNFSPPIKYWWVGLDCMHDGDHIPYQDITRADDPIHGDYRTLDFMLDEIGDLAFNLSQFDSRIY